MSLSRNLDCTFDLDQEVQQHGILTFRGDIPTKWQKRFCIVKDSFLLIFKEDDALKIKKSSYLTVKCQAAIPLGDCLISPYNDQATFNGIEITAYSSQMRHIIACDSRSQQLNWIRVFSDAARLTRCNFQISEQLITTLESQGLEKISLSEKYKKLFETESIKRQNQEEEATKLLSEFDQLRLEKQSIESELREIEAELASVRSASAGCAAQQNSVVDEATAEEASSRPPEDPAAEKKTEHEAAEMEDDAARQALASQLESERAAFSRQAEELAASLASLAEEQRARRAAEARLAEAEASLSRLHGCIAGEQTSYTPQEKQEMTSDVRQLKSYFESLGGRSSGIQSGAVGGGQPRPTKAVRDRARRLLEQRRSRMAPADSPAPAAPTHVDA